MKRFLMVAVLLISGCASQNYTVHPGAVNVFDSQSYDSLLVTHSVIESTKADLAANKFPASVASAVKTALNGLIEAYDVADSSYLVYHAAAVAGTATTAQQSALTTAIMNVNTSTNSLAAAKAAN